MLIRSQDKEKQTDTHCTPLAIRANKESKFSVVGIIGDRQFINMGEYQEKQTAIDVMDMIEDCIRCNMNAFDMPQDF